MAHDPVNNPRHYTSNPSGIQTIEIRELLPCCLADAVKYLCRAGLKGDWREDLDKCEWHLKRASETSWIVNHLYSIPGISRLGALADVYARHMPTEAGEALRLIVENNVVAALHEVKKYRAYLANWEAK